MENFLEIYNKFYPDDNFYDIRIIGLIDFNFHNLSMLKKNILSIIIIKYEDNKSEKYECYIVFNDFRNCIIIYDVKNNYYADNTQLFFYIL